MTCGPVGTCRSCAYLALEPSEEWDVCTHREVWQTQTYLDETCNNYSTTFDPANLAWADDFDGDLDGMPSARLGER